MKHKKSPFHLDKNIFCLPDVRLFSEAYRNTETSAHRRYADRPQKSPG